MNKTFLVLTSVFILVLATAIVSASDVLVWQGQYFTGTTFNTGTYAFNFTVYDASTGGNACYSNVTNLTTGSFGEWRTEQDGVGSACANVSKDYYLNINIGGADQAPRRRLVSWSFLRKDVDETTSGTFQANTQVLAPVINATQLVATEINVSSNANIFGVLRGHSPLKIGDAIQFTDANDSNLFSLYTAGLNITGNNVSSQYYGVIIHQIETHTNPFGIEECWWDRQDQEMRMCMDTAKIELWNDLSVRQDIDVSGNVNASNYTLNGRTIHDWDEASNVYLGSNLTATSAAYATIFTIPLTPGKMNIVQAYLAQSTSTTGVAIQNRAIVNESGPVGYCKFVTQTGGADAVDTIAVATNSADTGENTISLDTNVPFMNTVTCTVLADAGQKELIIQFDSEDANVVTTYAGSYYTNAVN